MTNSIKILTDSVLHIPLQKYDKDFTFIVNSKIYKTSSFIADLTSPIISSNHLIDPTLNEFTINTKSSGDFNLIINLIDFKPQEIKDDEFSFVIESLFQIGTEKVEINDKTQTHELTTENIFDLLMQHQKMPKIYKTQLDQEIEYFAVVSFKSTIVSIERSFALFIFIY